MNSRGKRRSARRDSRLVMIGGSPAFPQRLQLLPKGRHPGLGLTPTRPHPIPPQQAVLVLRQPCQRHEQDPLLRPAGFGGDGEDLGGYEAGFVAGRSFFPPIPDTGSTWAASSSRLCASRRWKAVWKSSGVRPPQKIRAASRNPWSLNEARTTSGHGAQWA